MSVPEGEITTVRDLLDRYGLGDRDFASAKLSEADLHNAILRGANLSEALLSEAVLTRADLRGVDLSWADLTGADLTGADLRGAILTRADLSGADLRHANFLRADLSLTVLDGAQLDGSIAPDGSVAPEAGNESMGEASDDDRDGRIAALQQELVKARERVVAVETQLRDLGVAID